MYPLGYSTKTYLQTGKKCAKTASIKGKRRKAAQKLTNLTIKRGFSPMDISAGSYENNIKLTKQSF